MKTLQFSLLIVSALIWAAAPAGAQALSPDQQAVHVLNRLAFGPKPGDIERVKQMGVQRYIDEQLHPETIPMPAALTERLASLATVNRKAGDVVDQFADLQRQVRDEDEGAKQKRRLALTAIAMETAEARLLRAIDSPRQLEEVMVDFWYNHFNVFSGKGIDRALVASYERDAIRPHVLGSFREMLGATAKHPAMLYYLDNHLSTVAGYTPGRVRAALGIAPKGKASGLNENFAREVMELHTLGVDGGYTQKDVTELARMLTGWTYDQRTLRLSNQTFVFDRARHDKGIKHWMGMEVKDNGLGEGEMALDVLAMHPSTAHHISYKLAQYFVQDVPPPALVDRMARMFLASKGDIRSVLTTLFSSQQFMAPEVVGAKFKTPYQFVVSASRASGAPVTNIQPLLGTMTQLGMPLYGCQTPDGWKNTQDAWLNPDALTRRITYATALAAGKLPLAKKPALTEPAAPELNAIQLQATLGGAISNRTLTTVSGTAEPLRAAMLLGSPDFMQH